MGENCNTFETLKSTLTIFYELKLAFPGGILLGMIEGISIMMNRMAGEEAYRGKSPVVMVTCKQNYSISISSPRIMNQA